jgi:hypothetical protein
LILEELPEILSQFRGKVIDLLWRGSRDGFEAIEFHDRCDDIPNTLTIVEDMDGNLFGGFTPITWESECRTKCDESCTSFLFTIKNPHGVPPTIFCLREAKKDFAVFCYEGYGPTFGFPDASDLRIADCCNIEGARRTSYAGSFGDTYSNTTQVGGKVGENSFFTGSPFFVVREIEVFEVTE